MSSAAAVRALIFDFDGVLADTEALHCAAFQAVAASAGLTMTRDDYFQRFLGLSDRDCLAALWACAGRPLTAETLDDLCTRKRGEFARLEPTAELYAGVADAVRRWHTHFILAVASGAFRDEIEPILQRAGVRDRFAAIIGAEDVRAGKPAPDPFLRALEAIQPRHGATISAAECVVIEDSPNGVIAARAAGMRCVAVTTHHERPALAAADAVIAHVTELRVEDFAVRRAAAGASS
jgi:beta-phosphoglucomutase-like phosphatase (HAD superfamily)